MWKLTIDGVDQTAIVDAFSVSLALNDRARATIILGDELPVRYQELVAYAADGVTPLFGGVILQRGFQGRTQADETFTCALECGDWFTYTDWAFTTVTYDVPVTLKQVLQDLVTNHLSAPGFELTLDAAQEDGPTLAPFAWATTRISDALRQLSDRTGYVVRISAAKALRMFLPLTLSAPFSMTELATNCHDVTWRDSDRTPYNTVTLLCGPAGLSPVDDERHDGDGTRRRWPLFAPFSQIIGALRTGSDAGGLDPGGFNVGIFGTDDLPWTVDLSTNEVVQRADQPARATGEYFLISYTGAFPFTVQATTGATPPVEFAEPRPEVRSRPVGEEIAAQMLASFQAAPRELSITTDVDGLEPGQALVVDLPTIRQIAGTFLVTAVGLSIVLDTVDGDRFWQYQVAAIESALYQGSWLDDWRKMGGLSGSGSVGAIVGGGGGSGPAIGPGTAGRLAKWATSTTLTDSLISETGDVVTVDADLIVTGTLALADHSVALTKLAAIASQTILGRSTSGNGDVEALATLPTGVQDNITRLGTVTSGVWNATPIALTKIAGAGAAGTVVRSNGTNWATSTLVLPNAATINRLVYATALNTYGESANLTFTGSVLALVGDQTVTGFLGSATYASQTTGWRIDATGGADVRYLFVDEMHARSFVTDLEMALAGGQIIAKSVAMVAATFTVPAAGGTSTLRVRDLPSMPDTPAFVSGDFIALRRFTRASGTLTIDECLGTVSAYADQPDGSQTWTFTRASGAAGGTMSGGTVAVDSLALDFGISGNGYYEVNAIDGAYGANSPYAQIVTWTTSPIAANRTVRTRFGKLTGITGTPDEYGMIAGTYAATNGSYFRASNATFELHNITAEWWAGSTPVCIIAPGGGSPYVSLGNPAQTVIGAGPGVMLAYNAGAGLAQMWCYALGGTNYFVFDGTLLYWRGVNTILDTAGNLTATSATLSGAITATSGSIAGDFVIGTGGQLRSGATAFGSTIGWWLDYNGGVPRFRVGNPSGDRLAWDGTTLTVRSGKLLIDGSASGHIGMGAAPYSIATLNIAADTDDASSYGLLVSNHSGTIFPILTYGDGRLFLGSQLYILPGAWDTTGSGINPTSNWNGPFAGVAQELTGWMRVFIFTGVTYQRAWLPAWVG